MADTNAMIFAKPAFSGWMIIAGRAATNLSQKGVNRLHAWRAPHVWETAKDYFKSLIKK
jgi:hypothetical protein